MSDLWIRAGVRLHLSPEERVQILTGDQETLIKVLTEKRFSFEGETYIPLDVGDVDFDLPATSCS